MKNKKIENKNKVKLNSEKVRTRERNIKIIRISLLITALFLTIIYFLLRIIYDLGAFTISLDPNLERDSGIVMYEKSEEKKTKRILKAEKLEAMDNISVEWLPKDLHQQAEGGHNGNNYIAYTFYLENQGSSEINYWYKVVVDDVVKNVDKAVRVMIYLNDEKTIYAKANQKTNMAEDGTEQFYSDEVVMLRQRKSFQADDVDKFTIVIWIEGDDPDCVDEIIGGEMKMHMEITEEHIDSNGNPVAGEIEDNL